MDPDVPNEETPGRRRGLRGIGRMFTGAATGTTPAQAARASRAARRKAEADERERLRAARAVQNPTARAVHTRNALMHWVHRQYHRGDRTPSCQGFMTSPGATFEGVPLEVEDLREALEYLADRHLVELIHKVNWSDPGYRDIHTAQRLCLTRLGLDCAESGTTVSEFLYPRAAAAGDTYHTTVQAGAQGTQIGRRNTMNNNTWGMQTSVLVELAKEVLAKVPELGLEPAAAAELVEEATALREKAEVQDPNPVTLRRTCDAVMGKLERAPESMTRQWLQAAGAAAIHDALDR